MGGRKIADRLKQLDRFWWISTEHWDRCRKFCLLNHSDWLSHQPRAHTPFDSIKHLSREEKGKKGRDVDGGKEHGCDELPDDSQREEGHS